MARVKEAIAAAMPEARAEVVTSEARIARPGKRAAAAPAPTAPGYDPYDAYYPSPMGDAMNMMMWASIFAMPSHPHVVVVNDAGDPVGTADTPGIEHADPDVGGDVGADAGGDLGGDAGGDLGGDVGGGDFGGGDFGGFFD